MQRAKTRQNKHEQAGKGLCNHTSLDADSRPCAAGFVGMALLWELAGNRNDIQSDACVCRGGRTGESKHSSGDTCTVRLQRWLSFFVLDSFTLSEIVIFVCFKGKKLTPAVRKDLGWSGEKKSSSFSFVMLYQWVIYEQNKQKRTMLVIGCTLHTLFQAVLFHFIPVVSVQNTVVCQNK